MAFAFTPWTNAPASGRPADAGRVNDGFAKMGNRVQALLDWLNELDARASRLAFTDNGDGTITFLSTATGVTDNGDGTLTIA